MDKFGIAVILLKNHSCCFYVNFTLVKFIPRPGSDPMMGRFWPADCMFDTPGVQYATFSTVIKEELLHYKRSALLFSFDLLFKVNTHTTDF